MSLKLLLLFQCFLLCCSLVQITPKSKWALQAWGLDGVVDPASTANVVDVDLDDGVDSGIITKLKSQGKIVICYISTGTYEPERAALASITGWDEIKGAPMGDWPEYWLNLNKLDKVKAVMYQRFLKAKNAGCDGIEGDNVDCYNNVECYQQTLKTTIAAAKTIQIAYNTWQAQMAHSLGMVMGLKNTGDLVPQLVSQYDFAVVEQCVQYKECSKWSPFITANKGVLVVEYKATDSTGKDPCLTTNGYKYQAKVCTKSGSQTCPAGVYYRNCAGPALKSDNAQESPFAFSSPMAMGATIGGVLVGAALVLVIVAVKRIRSRKQTEVQYSLMA